MSETWYVLEDGSVTHPREVKRDGAGILRHHDGRIVAMRGDVPRTRSVEAEAERDMKPSQPQGGYLTRESTGTGPGKPADTDGDLAAARADYQTKFGKRPFAGWDAATLRAKIVAG